jgi:hypothetical protein
MIKINRSIYAIFLLLSMIVPTYANASPVTDAKTKIREAIETWDSEGCAGTCLYSREYSVCIFVEDLDKQVAGKITGKSKYRKGVTSIDKSNLSLMKLVYSKCVISKEELPPTLRLIDIKKYKRFAPGCKALPKIRQGLGLSQFGGEHYRNNCLSEK